MSLVPPACEVIPALAYEWLADPPVTEQKFYQFIYYHEQQKQRLSAEMYRCALVQLRHQMGVDSIGFMHVPKEGETYEDVSKRLRKEAGL